MLTVSAGGRKRGPHRGGRIRHSAQRFAQLTRKRTPTPRTSAGGSVVRRHGPDHGLGASAGAVVAGAGRRLVGSGRARGVGGCGRFRRGRRSTGLSPRRIRPSPGARPSSRQRIPNGSESCSCCIPRNSGLRVRKRAIRNKQGPYPTACSLALPRRSRIRRSTNLIGQPRLMQHVGESRQVTAARSDLEVGTGYRPFVAKRRPSCI